MDFTVKEAGRTSAPTAHVSLNRTRGWPVEKTHSRSFRFCKQFPSGDFVNVRDDA